MSNQTYNVSDIKVPYQVPKVSNINPHVDYMFLGEAPGTQEEASKKPFVGDAGKNFNRWLEEAGIERSEVIVANTFRFKPNGNKVDYFFCSQTMAKAQDIEVVANLPKLNSKLLIKDFEKEITHIYKTIVKYKPKVVIAMGNIASWALLGQTKITMIAGQEFKKSFTYESKKHLTTVLPVFHPASILYSPDREKEAIIVKGFKRAVEIVIASNK